MFDICWDLLIKVFFAFNFSLLQVTHLNITRLLPFIYAKYTIILISSALYIRLEDWLFYKNWECKSKLTN